MDERQDWKVGELARRVGLTVRTLHHYDELGLVRPTRRTSSGHRLYGAADVERLYRVRALRSLGMPLERIGDALDGGADLATVLREHAAQLDARLATLLAARARVSSLVERETVPTSEDLLTLTQEMAAMDDVTRQYFDDEQLARLARRREEVGTEEIRRVEQAWPDLIARVQAAVDAGTDPASPQGAALAAEWQGLLSAFHGDDPGLRDSLFRMQEENAEQIQSQHGGPSPAQLEWIGRACAAG